MSAKKKNFSTMKMLGAQLQAARKAAGYTQQRLADLLKVDVETIASIEQGRRPLLPDLAAKLDKILDTKGMLAAGVAQLPDIDQFPMHAEQYMVHEREAVSLSWYDTLLVPGLLQTESYAYAVFSSRVPAFGDDKLAVMTAGRLKRQEIIHREDPPTLSFVVWEPAVRFPLGGEKVYREQLRHLRKCAEMPGISLQFLPLDRATHAGTAGSFTLMETPDHQHLAYSGSHHGSQLVADPEWVSILTRKYAMLRSQAMTPEKSRGLLDSLLGEQ
ncbi:helix-turn-helix transcriptional regulator [Streptomyces sp. NPDC047017]|uniref:helix-turn-helix domain-containing protein n=1 Tax=Streptomyces sp. NPDC047017 TaxID=3155024 RepID=UPI0033FEAD26